MTVPPPTPKSALNAPAAVPIAASRTSLGGHGGHTTSRARSHGETLAERPAPAHRATRARAAILCDIDGTLAPIVSAPRRRTCPSKMSRLLGRARHAATAASPASPGARPRTPAGSSAWADRVRGLARRGAARAGRARARALAGVRELGRPRAPTSSPSATTRELRRLRVRIEDKGADRRLPLARRARRGRGPRHGSRGSRRRRRPTGSRSTGAARCWRSGRRSPSTRAQAVRELVERSGVRTRCLRRRRRHRPRRLRRARRARRARAPSTRPSGWACARPRARAAIVDRADLVVDGTDGFAAVLEPSPGHEVPATSSAPACCCSAAPHRARRRRDRRRRARRTTARCSTSPLGWWALAAVGGLWLGRRPEATQGIARAARGRAHATDAARARAGRDPVQPAVGARAVHGRLGRGRLPDPAGPGDRGRLRDRRRRSRGASSRRRSRRSRAATACASTSSARRRSSRRSCCARPGFRSATEPAQTGAAALPHTQSSSGHVARVRHGSGRSHARRRSPRRSACSASVSTPCASESITSIAPRSTAAARSTRSGRAGPGWR